MNTPPYVYCLVKITYNDFLCHKKGELKNSSPLNSRKTINYCNYYAMNLFLPPHYFFIIYSLNFLSAPGRDLQGYKKEFYVKVCVYTEKF